MKTIILILAGLILASCQSLDTTSIAEKPFTDLSKRENPKPISSKPWSDVVIIVSDFKDVTSFFTQIGQFETVSRDDNNWKMRAPGSDSGYLHFVKKPNATEPGRPAGNAAWDTGCYWSLMVRARDISSIIEDAKPLGWEPLTELAYLEFGPSKLHVVVLRHEKTGVQVQLYERLTTPLPQGFTPFERISRPFNIMQMVRDRDAAYDFFQQGLGMDSFYYGKPSVSKQQEVMPLGIPPKLTTEIPYQAAIMSPFEGAEYGRFEMIEIMGMEGARDFSNRCSADYTGIYAVTLDVEDIVKTKAQLKARNIKFEKENDISVWIKSPDGGNIKFWQK